MVARPGPPRPGLTRPGRTQRVGIPAPGSCESRTTSGSARRRSRSRSRPRRGPASRTLARLPIRHRRGDAGGGRRPVGPFPREPDHEKDPCEPHARKGPGEFRITVPCGVRRRRRGARRSGGCRDDPCGAAPGEGDGRSRRGPAPPGSVAGAGTPAGGPGVREEVRTRRETGARAARPSGHGQRRPGPGSGRGCEEPTRPRLGGRGGAPIGAGGGRRRVRRAGPRETPESGHDASSAEMPSSPEFGRKCTGKKKGRVRRDRPRSGDTHRVLPALARRPGPLPRGPDRAAPAARPLGSNAALRDRPRESSGAANLPMSERARRAPPRPREPSAARPPAASRGLEPSGESRILLPCATARPLRTPRPRRDNPPMGP